MKNTRKLATITAVLTYALIVLGGVVRITGSGMGCGDHWPLCNGRIFPPLNDIATVIEWGHRLVAALVSFLVVATAIAAYLEREQQPSEDQPGPLNTALIAVALLVVQVMLGAVTVWWELPPTTVILHLGVAMGLLAAVMTTAFRASAGSSPTGSIDKKAFRAIVVTAGIAGVTLMLGGLTANLNAGPACQGFPFCNGQIWPAWGQGGLVHIHWAHRLLAYGLFAHSFGLAIRMRKRRAPGPVQKWAWALFAVVASQVIIAAAMVLLHLAPLWRVAHVAAGTGVWVCAVFLWLQAAARARRGSSAAG